MVFNTGPIAPESNPPINPEWYSPRANVIASMSLGTTTTVTTQITNQYVVGQSIRLLIPFYWGAQTLNNTQSYVIQIISDTQFVLGLNSLNSNPFMLAAKAPQYPQSPQCIPIGDINSGAINPNGLSNQSTVIPGSFIDISPN